MARIFLLAALMVIALFCGCTAWDQPTPAADNMSGDAATRPEEAAPARPNVTGTAVKKVVVEGNPLIPIRGLMFPPGDEYLELAGEMGANYICYGHWIVPDLNGNIVNTSTGWGSTLEETRQRVRDLHARGFKVWLYVRTPLYPMTPGEDTSEFTFELNPGLFSGLSPEARERFLAALRPKIMEVAVMAEEEGVKLFGPVAPDQLYLVLEPRSGGNFSYNWSNSLLDEVRGIYTGEISMKTDLNPDTSQNKKILDIADFTGWDWVSSDVFGSCDGFPGGEGQVDSYSEWRHIYTSLLGALEAGKAKSGAKGIIFGPELLGIDGSAHSIIMAERGYSSPEKISLEEWEEARATAWDMLLNDTMGRIDGYFFWSWWPGCSLPDYEYVRESGGINVTSRKSAGTQGTLPSETIRKYYSAA
jgi:hypothetical protein